MKILIPDREKSIVQNKKLSQIFYNYCLFISKEMLDSI